MLPSRSRILAQAICRTIRPEFRVSTDLFFLFAHHHQTRIYTLHLIYILYVRPFDQKLGSSFIYFFYVHTIIRSKYIVLFHLFFLLCMTIRRRLRVLTDLFLLFAHDHLTKRYGLLLFDLSFVHDHPTKNQGPH